MPTCTARRALALVLALAGLTACQRARYIAGQAGSQLRVLMRRRPITEVLRRRDLDPRWRAKLELVLLARRWAHRTVGLSRTAAYTSLYNTSGRPIAWNVSAAPKTALRPVVWRFPIVGAVPYLGFFEKADAQRRERALRAAGYDTQLRPVSAYSSLGWFADPLFSSMLRRARWSLVETVIHEMTHTTIFLRGRVAWSESLAVFVGQQGTLNLMAQMLGPLHRDIAARAASYRRRERRNRLVSALYRRLRALYHSKATRAQKLARREKVFAWAQARYRAMFPRRTWGSFATEKLNNAILLSYGRYNRGLGFHRRVYQRLGRRLDRFIALYKRVQRRDDPIGAVARAAGLPRPKPPQAAK